VVILSSHRLQNKDDAKTREQLIEEIDRLRKEVDRLKVAREDTGGQAGHRAAHADRSRFEAVIKNTPMVGVQGFDRDGVVHHWNEASTHLYGFSAAEAIGKRMQDLIITPGKPGTFSKQP
jgi:PAS domain-containing protein